MCPDANGRAGYPSVGEPCALVPGCNYPENGTLTPLATQCSNDIPDTDCEALFPCPTVGSTGQPRCDFWSVGTNPSTFPMVRSPTCLLPHLRNIAMKCKYLKVILGLYINLQVPNNVHCVVKFLNTIVMII